MNLNIIKYYFFIIIIILRFFYDFLRFFYDFSTILNDFSTSLTEFDRFRFFFPVQPGFRSQLAKSYDFASWLAILTTLNASAKKGFWRCSGAPALHVFVRNLDRG